MGMNLHSCCHLCFVRVMHPRGEEDKTILPFYKAHKDCMKEDAGLVETQCDSHQEADWMSDYDDWL